MKMIDIAEFRARVKAGKKRPHVAIRFVGATADPIAVDDTRVVSFVFSDNSVDRYGDTIDARGWVLDKYNANPIALFGHDAGSVENVIGRARNVRVEGQRLIGDIEFINGEVNPTAEAVYQMVKGGFLKTVSVGFQPLDWNLSKDKGRPGGVDFKKQELLEISIVPIPANPNALVQAKAAGIDVDRLALIQPQAPVSKKGLYEVSFLAQLLNELGYLEDICEWEADYEGDGSDIPQRLTEALKTLGQILVDMTVEEVGELLAEEEGEDTPLIGIDDVVALATLSPAQKALTRITRSLQHHDKPTTRSVKLDIEMSDESKALLAQIERAGKVLSSANETALRGACDHMTTAIDHVSDVLGTNAPADGDDVTKAAARARRQRVAAALKIANPA